MLRPTALPIAPLDSCRAPQTGPTYFALAWRYEPLVRLDALAFRTVRFALSVEALPSLHLAARLAAGVGGCAPGGCLLQAQLHNLGTETLTLTDLACPSSRWQLSEQPDSCGSLLIAPDASAALHRQLVPADAAEPAAVGDSGAGGPLVVDSGMTEAEAGLLAASHHAAAATSAAHRHLQLTAGQQQQQPDWQKRQRRQQQAESAEGSMDVVLLWEAGVSDGAPPRRGFTCVHGQR